MTAQLLRLTAYISTGRRLHHRSHLPPVYSSKYKLAATNMMLDLSSALSVLRLVLDSVCVFVALVYQDLCLTLRKHLTPI